MTSGMSRPLQGIEHQCRSRPLGRIAYRPHLPGPFVLRSTRIIINPLDRPAKFGRSLSVWGEQTLVIQQQTFKVQEDSRANADYTPEYTPVRPIRLKVSATMEQDAYHILEATEIARPYGPTEH
ncbi:hypothetical protein ACCO45_005809 [Purpureocillium lilacinum]|uniref:Uncharacterized protein n=1 Tax=Purpureocillium lilacinum TaxID=33203 RepID=A0ACC4DXP4_PURLI